MELNNYYAKEIFYNNDDVTILGIRTPFTLIYKSDWKNPHAGVRTCFLVVDIKGILWKFEVKKSWCMYEHEYDFDFGTPYEVVYNKFSYVRKEKL